MERSVQEGLARVRVVAAVLRDEHGRVLLARRPQGGPHGGLWEFPGGKVEPGETPETALARELGEELGVEVIVGPALVTVDHDYAHISVSLTAFACRIVRGEPRVVEHVALCWVAPGGFGAYPLLAADVPIRDRVEAGGGVNNDSFIFLTGL